MTIWIKPSGKEININDNEATVKYVKSLNWKKKVGRKSKKAAE